MSGQPKNVDASCLQDAGRSIARAHAYNAHRPFAVRTFGRRRTLLVGLHQRRGESQLLGSSLGEVGLGPQERDHAVHRVHGLGESKKGSSGEV
jgi:hypothetical protein